MEAVEKSVEGIKLEGQIHVGYSLVEAPYDRKEVGVVGVAMAY